MTGVAVILLAAKMAGYVNLNWNTVLAACIVLVVVGWLLWWATERV